MRTASTAFKQLLATGGNTFINSVSIQLASNETLLITNAELMNLEFEDCVGSDETFDALGATIINSCKITIYNGDESFSGYDFEDAVATVYVGLQVGSSIESRQIGVFTVDNATDTANSIVLSMLDNMSKFDEPYSKSSLSYPATLAQIIADACTVCGVTYNSNESDSDLDSLSINTKPDGESTTFRDVIGWVATIKCTFARCNSLGQLELKWFDRTTADSSLPRITSLASQKIAVSDTVVTELKITAGGVDTDEDRGFVARTVVPGITQNYLISISNNPFITTTNITTVGMNIQNKLLGLSFRKCNIVCLNNPLLEAGDAVRLTDTKGNFHRIIITRTTFSPIINQTVVCGADTPNKNSATLVSNATRVEATLKSALRAVRNKVSSVETIANNINQYFWFTSTGTDTGAHITEVPQEEFTDPTSENYHVGYNALFKSVGLAIRNGLIELATFSANTIRLGLDAGRHILIDADSIKFKDGPNSNNIFATFGSVITLGKTGRRQSYLRADYHSLQMIDRENNTYLHVSDLRDDDGFFTEYFIGDGVTTTFSTDVVIADVRSVKVDGVETTAFAQTSSSGVTLTTAPSDGSNVEIEISTLDVKVKAYTIGIRNENSRVGKMSYAEGYNITASGEYSHAEGYGTTASGFSSHAEGYGTTASSQYAHAEGLTTTASGTYAHAQNLGTIAHSSSQTALGRYNVEDLNNKYAVIIGNGRASTLRSNALAVTWDGDIAIELDSSSPSYTDDYKIYNALVSLGWWSSVQE